MSSETLILTLTRVVRCFEVVAGNTWLTSCGVQTCCTRCRTSYITQTTLVKTHDVDSIAIPNLCLVTNLVVVARENSFNSTFFLTVLFLRLVEERAQHVSEMEYTYPDCSTEHFSSWLVKTILNHEWTTPGTTRYLSYCFCMYCIFTLPSHNSLWVSLIRTFKHDMIASSTSKTFSTDKLSLPSMHMTSGALATSLHCLCHDQLSIWKSPSNTTCNWETLRWIAEACNGNVCTGRDQVSSTWVDAKGSTHMTMNFHAYIDNEDCDVGNDYHSLISHQSETCFPRVMCNFHVMRFLQLSILSRQRSGFDSHSFQIQRTSHNSSWMTLTWQKVEARMWALVDVTCKLAVNRSVWQTTISPATDSPHWCVTLFDVWDE